VGAATAGNARPVIVKAIRNELTRARTPPAIEFTFISHSQLDALSLMFAQGSAPKYFSILSAVLG
jgi:hypothetical protein